MKVTKLKKGDRVLIPKCSVATGFFARFLGLMGRRAIAEDEALFFPKCNSIHMFFMRFPIDVAFVSKDGEVVEVIESLKPWRMTLPRLKAAHALELKAHLCRTLGISAGDRLTIEGVL